MGHSRHAPDENICAKKVHVASSLRNSRKPWSERELNQQLLCFSELSLRRNAEAQNGRLWGGAGERPLQVRQDKRVKSEREKATVSTSADAGPCLSGFHWGVAYGRLLQFGDIN